MTGVTTLWLYLLTPVLMNCVDLYGGVLFWTWVLSVCCCQTVRLVFSRKWSIGAFATAEYKWRRVMGWVMGWRWWRGAIVPLSGRCIWLVLLNNHCNAFNSRRVFCLQCRSSDESYFESMASVTLSSVHVCMLHRKMVLKPLVPWPGTGAAVLPQQVCLVCHFSVRLSLHPYCHYECKARAILSVFAKIGSYLLCIHRLFSVTEMQ